MNLIPLLCRELGTRAGEVGREKNERILFPWNSASELWQSPKDVGPNLILWLKKRTQLLELSRERCQSWGWYPWPAAPHSRNWDGFWPHWLIPRLGSIISILKGENTSLNGRESSLTQVKVIGWGRWSQVQTGCPPGSCSFPTSPILGFWKGKLGWAQGLDPEMLSLDYRGCLSPAHATLGTGSISKNTVGWCIIPRQGSEFPSKLNAHFPSGSYPWWHIHSPPFFLHSSSIPLLQKGWTEGIKDSTVGSARPCFDFKSPEGATPWSQEILLEPGKMFTSVAMKGHPKGGRKRTKILNIPGKNNLQLLNSKIQAFPITHLPSDRAARKQSWSKAEKLNPNWLCGNTSHKLWLLWPGLGIIPLPIHLFLWLNVLH